jgi:hypothetical protein
VEYILRCRNYDGGFGSCVGAESHAAQGSSGPFFFFSDGGGLMMMDVNSIRMRSCAGYS